MVISTFVPEYELRDPEFERIRNFIEARTGIQLAPSKRGMVYNRLSRRLRDTGCRDFAEYLDQAEQPGSAESELFVNALTTNLTAFFREPYHFPMLASFLRETVSANGVVNIWCAAASTGEEAFSIAMTAIETLGPKPRVRIAASDIDTEVIASASAGAFSSAAVEKLSQERLQRFFLRGVGANTGRVRVRPELLDLVDFSVVNLTTPNWPWTEKFDVVFCRNVMIYFDQPTRESLILALHRVIKADGLLFVGHSDAFSEHRALFAPKGHTVYRRVSPGSAS